jgi:hypothetical protein
MMRLMRVKRAEALAVLGDVLPVAACGHERLDGTCPVCQRDRQDRWRAQLAAAGVACREWEAGRL